MEQIIRAAQSVTIPYDALGGTLRFRVYVPDGIGYSIILRIYIGETIYDLIDSNTEVGTGQYETYEYTILPHHIGTGAVYAYIRTNESSDRIYLDNIELLYNPIMLLEYTVGSTPLPPHRLIQLGLWYDVYAGGLHTVELDLEYAVVAPSVQLPMAYYVLRTIPEEAPLNGTFENGTVDGWTSTTGISISSATPHTGTYCAMLAGTSSVISDAVCSDIRLPSTAEKFDFYLWVPEGHTILLYCWIENSGGVYQAIVNQTIYGHNKYIHITSDTITPAYRGAVVNFHMQFADWGTKNYVKLLDDVVVLTPTRLPLQYVVRAWTSLEFDLGYDVVHLVQLEMAYTVGGTVSMTLTRSPTSGTAPLNVHFHLGTNYPSLPVHWDFDDGYEFDGVAQDVIHTFEDAGTYTVSCTCLGATATTTVTVSADPGLPVPDFYGEPVTGATPLTVQFHNLTSDFYDVGSWYWEFGDGEYSTDYEPSHTYVGVGQFTVTLWATNIAGSASTVREAYIDTSGYTVQLTPNFEVVHGAATPGDSFATYVVKLYITHKDGTRASVSKMVDIPSGGLNQVAFKDTSTVKHVYGVSVVDASASELVDWHWDYGDYNHSRIHHPTHWFGGQDGDHNLKFTWLTDGRICYGDTLRSTSTHGVQIRTDPVQAGTVEYVYDYTAVGGDEDQYANDISVCLEYHSTYILWWVYAAPNYDYGGLGTVRIEYAGVLLGEFDMSQGIGHPGYFYGSGTIPLS